jgi:hypothetical protein
MQVGGSAADSPLKPLTWKRVSTSLFVLVAVATSALVARHFLRTGWPLHNANLWLVSAAAVIFLGAYAAKAWGWQRLFSDSEKPAVLTLAAAGGAASVGGIALPGRCDEVIRVAVVRRCRRRTASYGAVALSIVLLGLIDSAAMTPLAAVALAALGLGANLALAVAFVCASAASAVLPVAPAGAAMQAGAGAAILVAAGVHAEEAIAFGIAAQALVIAAGAAFVLGLAAWHAQGRLALARS